MLRPWFATVTLTDPVVSMPYVEPLARVAVNEPDAPVPEATTVVLEQSEEAEYRVTVVLLSPPLQEMVTGSEPMEVGVICKQAPGGTAEVCVAVYP